MFISGIFWKYLSAKSYHLVLNIILYVYLKIGKPIKFGKISDNILQMFVFVSLWKFQFALVLALSQLKIYRQNL